MAEWYCQAVVQEAVTACRWERLACHRFLHMLQEARKPRSEFIYDADRVADVCAFGETLPHSKGFEGNIVLEPVQCWWLAAIFGFRERDTGRRWTREVALWVPRKNGKTELAKIVVLYCQNFEGEPGAEGVIIAGSERQADIPFKAIRHTIDEVAELRDWTLAKGTHEEIRFRRHNAVLKLLAGRAPNLDGLNPHVVLAEEVHAQNQDVIGVIKTAQGARLQPLWLGISTAGRNATGPAYDGWKSDQQVLEGKLRADRVFIAMYAADAEDEERRFDPIIVEKLNPLFGVSLKAGALCLFFGMVRLLALWVNGRRGRETSLIRTLGCLGGFAFWLAIALGFLLTAPPITTGVAVYTVLALAELHASGRAASDMAAEDTFGLRARRRQNGGGSSRSSSAT
ncbi:terminase large subunit domain-containing protein [Methylobacterium sp. R2-1]|uniref:terminase large subunit domain-containing protein n=1 Tax=Methylobacterium sp. R2-1 TaxID=2587064 RepID=UPI00160CD0D3|nr:terminase large subunit [Methylobacterium sp. R2-1]MBB2964731.1 phage terminase large subunit-like protein [Methylobacterium sp. R2-1]